MSEATMTTIKERVRSARALEVAARVGYVTKGLIYLLVGVLALRRVLGEGGAVVGGEQAVRTVGAQPFGQVLLVALAVGLFGYALWRVVQATLDPEHVSDHRAGMLERIGCGVSAVVHAALGVTALQLAFGERSGGSGARTWMADVVALDVIGPLFVMAVGLALIGYGLYQVKRAFAREFEDNLDLHELSGRTRRVVTNLGRAALTARAAVFATMGVVVIGAGLSRDPSQPIGVGAALREIGSASYGAVLLGLVAAGLTAYGAFQFVQARYRRIPA